VGNRDKKIVIQENGALPRFSYNNLLCDFILRLIFA
jgi:hypothetical protein